MISGAAWKISPSSIVGAADRKMASPGLRTRYRRPPGAARFCGKAGQGLWPRESCRRTRARKHHVAGEEQAIECLLRIPAAAVPAEPRQANTAGQKKRSKRARAHRTRALTRQADQETIMRVRIPACDLARIFHEIFRTLEHFVRRLPPCLRPRLAARFALPFQNARQQCHAMALHLSPPTRPRQCPVRLSISGSPGNRLAVCASGPIPRWSTSKTGNSCPC